MPQLSLSVPASTPLPPLPDPLAASAHPDGVRLTGVWTEDVPLAEARRAVAEIVAQLPLDVAVQDLFTGISEPAEVAAARLREAPDVANAFHARHVVTDQHVWLRLFGMYQLGRSDLVLALEPDVDVAVAYDLLTRYATAQLAAPAELAGDEPLPFGFWRIGFGGPELADRAFWAMLRDGLHSHHLREAFDARMASPAPRLVLEAERVTTSESDAWLIGASRALRTFAAQGRARQRFGLGPPSRAPNAADAFIHCDRVEAADGFFAHRAAPADDTDSGWQLACLDPDHVHDAASTRVATLGKVAAMWPELVPYLAFPEGWVISREEGRYWVRPPDDDRSYLDEGAESGPPWEPPSP